MIIYMVVRSWGTCHDDAGDENVKAFTDVANAAVYIEKLKIADQRKREIVDALHPKFEEFAFEQVYPRSKELEVLMKDRLIPDWQAKHDAANEAHSIKMAAWLATRQAFILKLMDDFGCTAEEKSWFAAKNSDKTFYTGFYCEKYDYSIEEVELD